MTRRLGKGVTRRLGKVVTRRLGKGVTRRLRDRASVRGRLTWRSGHLPRRPARTVDRVPACLLVVLLTLAPPADRGLTGPATERDGDGAVLTAFFAGVTRTASALTARMAQTDGLTPRGVWQWPLPGQPEVVKRFDPPEERWLPGHRGIDLAGMTTSPVLAVADGTVTYSGSIAGVGIVSVTHADGVRSTYQPVTDRISRGEQVAAGDRIGHLGAIGSHCLLRTCLHLGAVRGDEYLDPLLFLQPWELTLLPHEH
ncbi:murein hydrolase activator EnvC family protein [Ornithinimicrobium cavernae]|uniref:murein hydrolase activator EnvC family protein n=1 Tax=Ornithinimicrobium cavernae TaxID=2666047 RepID=UPI000D693CD5|nr:M23 family metallopeptidase [Ornithinimicrobium cavernae]